jgi:membrane protease YdiL (CAAX protease family)
MVLWWPLAGRARYHRMRTRAGGHRWSRSMARKWIATAVLVPIAVLGDVSLAACGIRWPDEWGSTVFSTAIVLAGAVFILVRLRIPRQRARLRRVMQPFGGLVPHRDERLRFVGLAVTAGVTEELLFRAFGLSYLFWLWPGMSSDTALLVTSATFGLAHLYQGWKNVVLTALLGAMFALLTIDTGSVVPAIVVHTLIDLRILLLTPLVEADEPVVAPQA